MMTMMMTTAVITSVMSHVVPVAPAHVSHHRLSFTSARCTIMT